MEFRAHRNYFRRKIRFQKFGLLKNIPSQKKFMKVRFKIYFLIVLLVIIVIQLIRFEENEDRVGISLGIFINCIAIFGIVVKILLNTIFPILVLNDEGMKFFDSKLIKWTEVKMIRVKKNDELAELLYITKTNSKVIIKKIRSDYFPNLPMYCKSFFEKYKARKYKRIV